MHQHPHFHEFFSFRQVECILSTSILPYCFKMTDSPYQDALSQLTMTLNFIRSSSSIVPQETHSTLVFMIQHCFSYVSDSHSSKNASVASASPLNMVINYIDGPICDNISDSLRSNIRFMVWECRSTLLSSMPLRLDVSSCCTTAGDEVVLPSAADEGDRAGSSCRSVPRSHHLGDNRSNHDPPLMPADEGGQAGSSCRSVPRSNHLFCGGDDSSGGTPSMESIEAIDEQKAPLEPRKHRQRHPTNCSDLSQRSTYNESASSDQAWTLSTKTNESHQESFVTSKRPLNSSMESIEAINEQKALLEPRKHRQRHPNICSDLSQRSTCNESASSDQSWTPSTKTNESHQESFVTSKRPLNSIYLRSRSSSRNSDRPPSDQSPKPPKAKRASNALSKFIFRDICTQIHTGAFRRFLEPVIAVDQVKNPVGVFVNTEYVIDVYHQVAVELLSLLVLLRS